MQEEALELCAIRIAQPAQQALQESALHSLRICDDGFCSRQDAQMHPALILRIGRAGNEPFGKQRFD